MKFGTGFLGIARIFLSISYILLLRFESVHSNSNLFSRLLLCFFFFVLYDYYYYYFVKKSRQILLLIPCLRQNNMMYIF